jgi:hypothetical protein
VALPRGVGCVLAWLGPALASRAPGHVADNAILGICLILLVVLTVVIQRLP